MTMGLAEGARRGSELVRGKNWVGRDKTFDSLFRELVWRGVLDISFFFYFEVFFCNFFEEYTCLFNLKGF
jgi:hypothetical protein